MALRIQENPTAWLEDEALVARFRGGDTDAMRVLVERYRRFARSKARSYFIVGADADDLEQECLIGLFKAVRDFREDRQTSFRAFAEVCVTRQVITAIKTATRYKHQPLNQYVSISPVRGTNDEAGGDELIDLRPGVDPADEVVSRASMAEMRRRISELLSGLEVDVLRLYVEGKSYQEISEHLGRHVKSIDNALQRIKRKLDLRDEEPARPVRVAC